MIFILLQRITIYLGYISVLEKKIQHELNLNSKRLGVKKKGTKKKGIDM